MFTRKYKCPKCGNITEIKSFWRWSITPHMWNIWRHVKCSHCGKKTWVKKMKEDK
jgi:rRNA maturation protein Nop10